jgi:two-component system response regulator ResD
MGALEQHAHSVLVIDDYDGLREAFAAALTVVGFDVITASSGREALDILGDGFRPCVVLLDVCMPEMDGWMVWDRMQAHTQWSQTPVVMLSARSVDRDRVRRVGIREFLSKPVEHERLVDTIERHCERQPYVVSQRG